MCAIFGLLAAIGELFVSFRDSIAQIRRDLRQNGKLSEGSRVLVFLLSAVVLFVGLLAWWGRV